MEVLQEQFYKKLQNTQTNFVRSITTQINWNARLIGIKGARGTGKTTLLLQYIKLNLQQNFNETLYVSLDNFWFAKNNLHDLVNTFVQQGGTKLFLDEVHKYEGWAQALKNFYDDYPNLKIVFTGSSLLEILNSRADLSRRAVIYTMQGFSFREYLAVETNLKFEKYTIDEIIAKHTEISLDIISKIKPLKYFDTYLKSGYYPFYNEIPELYYQRLSEVVNLMLEIELPQLRQMEIAYIPKIKQLLSIIASSVPFTPNTSKLSEKIQINRTTLLSYFGYLDEIGLTINVNKSAFGISQLQKPSKIYLENTNLAFMLAQENTNIGNLRETFFANQVSYNNQVLLPEKGDFFVNEKYTFEIGGASKTLKQIKYIENSFIAMDNLEIGSGNKIPLWLFGFLY